ncbi:hypothetical protein [Glaciecola sp. MF2-115]|uniref:hypothetical protein n=1 Tax=Glaciecola sp. MF2-115 TaxID=3384827 RepID=UPI0039A17E17
MNSLNIKLLIGILISIALISTGVVYWKIAQDEIFYLCGNFSAGVKKSSVVRQLETANLSDYTITNSENGSNIVFKSRLYFVTNQCIIEIDKSDNVVVAAYQ